MTDTDETESEPDETLTLDDLPQPEREERVHPDELYTDSENPNTMPPDRFDLLCDRMQERGWLGGPILADTDGLVADGEHRMLAAQDIGLEEVPVKFYNWTDAQRRLIRLEMNKNTGEHDPKRDAQEYDTILEHGYVEQVDDLAEAANDDIEQMLDDLLDDTADPDDDLDLDTTGDVNDPYDEWDKSGTVDYENDDITPEFSIKVHFETKADLDEFADLVDRDLNESTRYIYYPDEPDDEKMSGEEYVATTDD